jgi:hypothetical protein
MTVNYIMIFVLIICIIIIISIFGIEISESLIGIIKNSLNNIEGGESIVKIVSREEIRL